MGIKAASLREDMAQAYIAKCLWATIHTTGATDGSGAVAIPRVPVDWEPITTGSYSVDLDFLGVPPGTTVVRIGFWDTETGGEFQDDVPAAATFPDGGDFDQTVIFVQE